MEKIKRSYEEIRKEAREAAAIQELRKLHKELRAYGDGIPFFGRYPKAFAPIKAAIRTVGVFIGILIGAGMAWLLSGIK